MKKQIILLLTAVLCLSLCACGDKDEGAGGGDQADKFQTKQITLSKTREIEGKLDAASTDMVIDHKTIPDMALFFGRRDSSKEAVEKGESGWQYIELESAEERAVLLEYFALLQEQFGFALTASYNVDWNAEPPFGEELMNGFWGVGFTATAMDAGQELGCFVTDEPCDLCVYGAEGGVTLVYSSLFNIVDTGHRRAGYPGDELAVLFGEHVSDAYETNGKSYYNVGDKMLEVKAGVRTEFDWVDCVGHMGAAKIIRNGSEAVDATARIGKLSWVHYYAFDIENIGGVEGQNIYLRLPVDAMEDGTVFRLKDFLSGHQREEEMECYLLRYTPSYADNEIAADFTTSLRGCMEACTIRVLNWDSAGVEDCVVYISMKMLFDGDPLEVECLLAAPVNDEELLKAGQGAAAQNRGTSGSSDEKKSSNIAEFAKLDCLTCGGDGDCNNCGGYGEVECYAAGGDTVKSKCSHCHGSGDCRSCGGSGKRE